MEGKLVDFEPVELSLNELIGEGPALDEVVETPTGPSKTHELRVVAHALGFKGAGTKVPLNMDVTKTVELEPTPSRARRGGARPRHRPLTVEVRPAYAAQHDRWW